LCFRLLLVMTPRCIATTATQTYLPFATRLHGMASQTNVGMTTRLRHHK
jgi:hypothetical protein